MLAGIAAANFPVQCLEQRQHGQRDSHTFHILEQVCTPNHILLLVNWAERGRGRGDLPPDFKSIM